MRLRTCTAFLAAVALALLMAGCSTVTLPGDIPPLPTPVPSAAPGTAAAPSGTAYTVTRGSVSQSVNANIKVVANRQDALYFKASGQLGDMPVKVGDQVQQGDLLAQLNVRALQDQAALNTLTVKQNRVKLERTKQDTTMDYEIVDAQVAVVQAEAAIQNARLKLEKLQSPPSSEEVNLAKANSEKARVGLQRAQAHYDKVAFSPDISILIEASNLQQATIDYTIAQATYNLKVAGPSKQDTASAQNDIRVAEASLTRAQADLSSKKVEASLRDYDIQLASIEVDKTAQTVDQLNRQVSDGSIVAPYSGTVTGVVAKAGDPVTAFSPVIQLADPKSIELVADADDASLAKLTVGQKATITFNQWPGQPLPATVSDLPAASQQSSNPLLSFVAQLPGIQAPATNGSDRSPRLKLDSAVDLATGMQGKATFVFLQKDKVLLLPKAALRTSGSRTFANVQRADSVEQVEVRTGAQADDMVEILSGLQEGDVVIGPGLNRLPSPTPAQAQLSTPTPMPAPTRTLLPSPSPSQAPLSSPAPMATVAPTPTVVVLEVANTLGKGAFIRREPTSDPIRTWPDGAAMVVAGEKRQVGGMEWINVQDPAGNVGWMSSNVLVPLSGSQ